MASTLTQQPELVAIYFSTAALIGEFLLVVIITLGKSKWFTDTFDFPRFHMDWKNPLVLCLLGQIGCVEMFHVFNIWLYTSAQGEADRCNYGVKMVVFFYVAQCFFLYLFLMIKVQHTFLGHTKFTKYLDLFLKLLTFGVIPSLAILVFFLFSGSFVSNGFGLQICVMIADPYWVMVLVFLDFVLNAGFLLLFVLPLRQLIEAEEKLIGADPARFQDDAKRQQLKIVAKRNLTATSVCVVISIAALAAMIWEAYADDVNGKVFGCFPCVVASTSNTFLMLITTKGAWRSKTDSGSTQGNPNKITSPSNKGPRSESTAIEIGQPISNSHVETEAMQVTTTTNADADM